MSPPFQYEGYRSPYTSTIGDMIRAKGQIPAQAAQNIGSTIAGTIQQATDPRQQLARQQVEANDQVKQYTTVVNQIQQHFMETAPDGAVTINLGKARQAMASANVPLHMQDGVIDAAAKLNKSAQDWRTLRTDHQADFAHSTIGMIHAGMGGQLAVATSAALAKANGMATDEEIQQLLTGAATAGDEQILQSMVGIRGLSEKYKDIDKAMALPRESPGIYHPGTGTIQPVPSVSSGQPEPNVVYKDAAGEHPVVFDKAKQKYLFNGQDVTDKVTRPTPTDNATLQNERFIKIQQAKTLGQPVSAADEAWAKAYQTQRTIGPEASAAAAADRQAATIAQQNTLRQNEHTFLVAQAGRKELTDNVVRPYQQAQQSAQELRDLVHSAQSGNKEAASLQALQATMTTVRANGLNRLNQAEMNLPANAGSLWDRIQNHVGKLVSGQPIDAALQKDLLDYADLIERGAYNRYKAGHQDITTRYGLTEKPSAPPVGANRDPDGLFK